MRLTKRHLEFKNRTTFQKLIEHLAKPETTVTSVCPRNLILWVFGKYSLERSFMKNPHSFGYPMS